MKIIEQSPNKLVFQRLIFWKDQKNLLNFGILAVVVLMLMFSILFLLIAEAGVYTLNCQKIEPTQIECKLHNTTYFSFGYQQETTFPKLLGAELIKEEKQDEEGKYSIFAVRLLTPSEKIFYRNYGRGGNAATAWVNAVNNFINTPTMNTLNLVEDTRQGSVWATLFIVGLMYFLIAIGLSDFLSLIRPQTYLFHKQGDKLIYSHCYSTFSFKIIKIVKTETVRTMKEYALRDITEINLEKSAEEQNPYAIVLHIESTTEQLLHLPESEANIIFKHLKAFLNLS